MRIDHQHTKPLWPVWVSWLWDQASAPQVLVQVTAQTERIVHKLLIQLSETSLKEKTSASFGCVNCVRLNNHQPHVQFLVSVSGSVSKTNLFLLLCSGYLCLLLQFALYKQMSPNLHGLHGIRCRVLSWDGQWAGQQQLSGDHRLQKEGERRGGLEDVVRNHTCVVYNHTHIHTA